MLRIPVILVVAFCALSLTPDAIGQAVSENLDGAKGPHGASSLSCNLLSPALA